MSAAGAAVDLRLREKRLGRAGRGRPVLAGVTVVVPPGACLAVMGPSGIGKTTLLRLLAGLDDAFDGTRAPIAGPLGMVFQEPRLLPWRSVRDNLALVAPSADARRIAATLARCRVDAALLDRYPDTLSLGERRRVALARALVVEPALLVLDEPLVSLDEATAADLRAVLAEILADRATTVVLVDHDLDHALRLADRIVRLEGSPATIAREATIARPRETRDAAWLAAEAASLRERGF